MAWKDIAKLSLVCVLILSVYGQLPRKKFQYKLSFKGPHLVQRDQSIPFWEYFGDTIASDENIRLTPSLRSKKGSIWTRNINNADNWIIEVVFKVTGRGRVGADGLAIWYTEQKGYEGPVFGSNDQWRGLGVFMDSFDNDAQRNNPYIMAMVNDGTKRYDHQSDGMNQQLAGCLRDFRNKPFPVKARIEYYKNALTIWFHGGMTNNAENYELCIRQENVVLPKNGYFGVSAATGGLADDHDVLQFLTHSYITAEETQHPSQVTDDEKKKFEKEFEDYYAELERQKEDFKKEHPDKEFEPDDKWFESQGERELKMIFDGQSAIHMVINQLSRKLDELIGRQELVLSKVNNIPVGGVQVPQGQQGGHQQQQQQPMIDTIRRHEVDRVLNNQNEVMQGVRELRTFVLEISNRLQSGGLQQQQQQQQQGLGSGPTAQMQLALHEIQEHMRTVRDDVTNIKIRPAAAAPCPQASSCLSTTIFFLGISIQIIVLIAYAVYRQNKEAQAKKFY